MNLHARLGPAVPAAARGWLYALPDPAGWYPALVPDPAGAKIRGFLHSAGAAFGPADLAALDAYEGAEYSREDIAISAGGAVHCAQAYVFNAPLPRGAQLIPGGDFRAFLHARGWPEYQ